MNTPSTKALRTPGLQAHLFVLQLCVSMLMSQATHSSANDAEELQLRRRATRSGRPTNQAHLHLLLLVCCYWYAVLLCAAKLEL